MGRCSKPVVLILFIECYQKEILSYFETHHEFSIRYHKKNSDLYYKNRSGQRIKYFQVSSYSVRQKVIQQAGNYFKIAPFESINSFTDSRTWRMCNFKYRHFAKLDYQSCFNSIYTHTFKWIIERNTANAKRADDSSNLFIVIDRILQNINGHSSNGIIVGPEFSRMMAEILLQHIDSKIALELATERITDYSVFRYVDDIWVFANNLSIVEQIIEKYANIGGQYLLHLNELKLSKGSTPYLPKDWLGKVRHLSDIIGSLFYHGTKLNYDAMPENERFIVKAEFVHVDRIKDEIAILMKGYSEDKRSIVSFLLSALLNNISKKKNGYRLFKEKDLNKNKALLLLDMALYIYAFYPSFEQTRKIISLITYMNDEIDFKHDIKANDRLNNMINKYSFIFHSGNLFDLCDWFPFCREFKIILNMYTENILIKKAHKANNPIMWANLLMYFEYYKPFFQKLTAKIEQLVESHMTKFSDDKLMEQEEFWYLLVFHNCPYFSPNLLKKMSDLISEIDRQAKLYNTNLQKKSSPNKQERSYMATYLSISLVCEFLEQKSINGQKPRESLFNWNGIKNFGENITYRTYQRTLFKRYHKRAYKLYASVD